MKGLDRTMLAELEYGSKKKARRKKFLERMQKPILWEKPEQATHPRCPQAGRGRRSYALSSMLRAHCVQLVHNASDPRTEDMLREGGGEREHLGGTVADEEPIGRAGCADAADEEGEPVALRDEDACRHRRGDGSGARLRSDVGEFANLLIAERRPFA